MIQTQAILFSLILIAGCVDDGTERACESADGEAAALRVELERLREHAQNLESAVAQLIAAVDPPFTVQCRHRGDEPVQFGTMTLRPGDSIRMVRVEVSRAEGILNLASIITPNWLACAIGRPD